MARFRSLNISFNVCMKSPVGTTALSFAAIVVLPKSLPTPLDRAIAAAFSFGGRMRRVMSNRTCTYSRNNFMHSARRCGQQTDGADRICFV